MSRLTAYPIDGRSMAGLIAALMLAMVSLASAAQECRYMPERGSPDTRFAALTACVESLVERLSEAEASIADVCSTVLLLERYQFEDEQAIAGLRKEALMSPLVLRRIPGTLRCPDPFDALRR
jgi:hypothetical protein